MKNRNEKTFVFCQKLKIQNLSQELKQFYSDIQTDYKRIAQFLIRNSGYGYCYLDQQGNSRTVSAGPRNISANLAQLIKILAKGGTLATNAYGIIYDKYQSTGESKSTCKAGIYIKEVNQEKAAKLLTDIVKEYSLDKDEWVNYRNEFFRTKGEKKDFDSIWKKAVKKLPGNESANLVTALKKENVFPKASQGDNYNYCTALFDMVISFFSGWVANGELHQQNRENLKQTIEKYNENPVYVALRDFSVYLQTQNYGLTGRVLKNLLAMRDKNANPDSNVTTIFAEFAKNAVLLAAKPQELYAAFYGVKEYWKLQRMKEYISVPNFDKDYQVPFGLTGKGFSFVLESAEGKLTAQIKGCGSVVCYRSYYFSDLTVTPKTQAFEINFCHRVKSNKPHLAVAGKNIRAVIKEMKIQKRDGEFYLYLPYSITHDVANFNSGTFFQTASPKPEAIQALPNNLTIASFDMNISTPLTGSKCLMTKAAVEGKLKGLHYGSGDLLAAPVIISKNTNLSNQLVALSNKMNKLKGIIKDYKLANKTNTPLHPDAVAWLEEQSVELPPCGLRHRIQKVLKKLTGDFKKIKQRCRDNGHTELSENIRLLQVWDMAQSLHTAYTNIHVKNQSQVVFFKKANDKRANFRDFVSKKFASEMVKYAEGCNLAFVEDIDLDFDRDSDFNSLSRLFAAGQLKKAIENAFNKQGMAVTFVQPALTSKTDPVTGELGFRPKPKDHLPKENLYVVRDNKIGVLHSDIAASLNVLLVGLNHSVYPRRVYVKNSLIAKKESNNQRITSFLNTRMLSKTYFSTGAEKLVETKEKPNELLDSWVYVTPDGYISEKQKQEREALLKVQIMDLRKNGVPLQEFSLTPEPLTTYKGFQVKQVLDLAVS